MGFHYLNVFQGCLNDLEWTYLLDSTFDITSYPVLYYIFDKYKINKGQSKINQAQNYSNPIYSLFVQAKFLLIALTSASHASAHSLHS